MQVIYQPFLYLILVLIKVIMSHSCHFKKIVGESSPTSSSQHPHQDNFGLAIGGPGQFSCSLRDRGRDGAGILSSLELCRPGKVLTRPSVVSSWSYWVYLIHLVFPAHNKGPGPKQMIINIK